MSGKFDALTALSLLDSALADADKLSGMELKAPVLSNALKQPFSTTGTLSSLMARCEAKVKELDQHMGGLESLLEACPQYRGLFLIKCAPHCFQGCARATLECVS